LSLHLFCHGNPRRYNLVQHQPQYHQLLMYHNRQNSCLASVVLQDSITILQFLASEPVTPFANFLVACHHWLMCFRDCGMVSHTMYLVHIELGFLLSSGVICQSIWLRCCHTSLTPNFPCWRHIIEFNGRSSWEITLYHGRPWKCFNCLEIERKQ